MKTQKYDPLQNAAEGVIRAQKWLEEAQKAYANAKKSRGEQALDRVVEQLPLCQSQGVFEGVAPEHVEDAICYLEKALIGEWECRDEGMKLGAFLAATNHFGMPLIDLPAKT